MNALRGIHRALVLFFYLALHSMRFGVEVLLLLFSKNGSQKRKQLFAISVLQLFRDLGATFIKLGQIMSTRPDLFSAELIQALSQLQDNVGPFPFEEVKKAIEFDFLRPLDSLFSAFEQYPIASASVAQVHRARLLDGTVVAVKVRRPLIEKLCKFDLAVIRVYAQILNWIPSVALLAPLESFEQFAQAIVMQLDFSMEAANNERFQKSFFGNPDVLFPQIYSPLCSQRILTMQFIEGYKILDCVKAGADPKRMGRIGFQVMLQMVFFDGFVHADLHPGNILITKDHRLALLDLGLVAELPDVSRLIFLRYFSAWAHADGKTMADILLQNSPSQTCKEPEKFTQEIETFVSQYQGKRLGQVQVVGVVFNLLQILRKFRIRINPIFTMVNIAIALTEGIGKQLDPDLDLLKEALPFFGESKKHKEDKTN